LYYVSVIDNCSPSPCINATFCINKLNDFDCNCQLGYTGKICDAGEKCPYEKYEDTRGVI